ncbi:type II toxin-antitoxin system TacA family antitoxin [Methylomonas lenta]|uniref:type II toxin-antitoxin system TacA family antitoxin n=1 Tax=Methylomonas lenta TaxID=980561 RepID=UPI000836AFE0|nr:DUF1778 domain-containing protein [Methylomonas lenta]
MSTASIDRGRITARVPLKVQETLEMAASMVGATVNQFIVQTALREAERIIEQEREIHLSMRDSEALLKALDNPPLPNEKLLATLQDYAARRNDQTGTIGWTPRAKGV